jgi:hypothetical protein
MMNTHEKLLTRSKSVETTDSLNYTSLDAEGA